MTRYFNFNNQNTTKRDKITLEDPRRKKVLKLIDSITGDVILAIYILASAFGILGAFIKLINIIDEDLYFFTDKFANVLMSIGGVISVIGIVVFVAYLLLKIFGFFRYITK